VVGVDGQCLAIGCFGFGELVHFCQNGGQVVPDTGVFWIEFRSLSIACFGSRQVSGVTQGITKIVVNTGVGGRQYSGLSQAFQCGFNFT